MSSRKSTKKTIGKKRPSPSESANDFDQFTYKLGNDGNWYVNVVRKNDTKYWKKTILAKNYMNPKSPPKNKTNIEIVIGDIINFKLFNDKEYKKILKTIDPKDLYDDKKLKRMYKPKDQKYRRFADIKETLRVTPGFMKILMRSPKILNKNGNGFTAYLFGKHFASDYYILSEVETNWTFIGILQLTNISEEDRLKLTFLPDFYWEKLFFPKKEEIWSEGVLHPTSVKEIRNKISEKILFTGISPNFHCHECTTILAHFDGKRNVDSLIIDGDYIFPKIGWC